MIKKGLNVRLAEIGKIKLGKLGGEKKTKTGKTMRLPLKFDHFVITTTERDNNDDLIVNEELMKKLGGKPKSIPIMLLYDDIDLNFYTSFAFYKGAQRLCHGDGEIAHRMHPPAETGTFEKWTEGAIEWDNEKGGYAKRKTKISSGEIFTAICDPETCPYHQEKGGKPPLCKVSGILSCIIPTESKIGGVYRFRTHSYYTVSAILASLELIKTVSNGVLVGIPLRLSIVKKATKKHGNVVTAVIEFDGNDIKELRSAAMIEQKNRIDMKVNMKMLEDRARAQRIFEAEDDPKEVQEEFYPEAVEHEIIGEAEVVGQPPENEIEKAEMVLKSIGVPKKEQDGGDEEIEPEGEKEDEVKEDEVKEDLLDIF